MISVVIPVLNNYKVTNELLSDISKSSVLPPEIILIDNCSSENIYELVSKYKQLNLTYIRTSRNIGVNAAWDLGRDLAKNKYIAILNSDIRIGKKFFEKIIEVMNEDETVGICSTRTSKNLDDVLNEDKPVSKEYCQTMSGSAFVLTKKASDEIGPIPRQLFIFCGDDFILARIKQLKYKAIVMNNNEIFHYDHASLYFWNSTEAILDTHKAERYIFENKIKKQFNFQDSENEGKEDSENFDFRLMGYAYMETEFADLFKELFKLLKFKTYVELGVKDGYMFNQMAPLVKRAVGVDVLPMTKVKQFPNVETYQMSTVEFSKIWREPIDFLFIDANHEKEHVLEDFDLFSPFVREGTGIIALHDTHPICSELLHPSYCSNAWEAAWEIRTNPKYKNFEIFTLPGPWAGLSLIRKSRKQLSINYKRSNNIYDCFMFSNELDILEIRLNELYDVVDKFVIVEANETHTGKSKRLFFEENKKRFSKFLDKIIYVPISFPPNVPLGWGRENFQRNQIVNGLTECKSDDIIIISDVDEIPRKELFEMTNLWNIINKLNGNFIQLHQPVRYYFLNYEDSWKWYGSIIVYYAGIKQYSPQTFRDIREHPQLGVKMDNAGWHFSYIADIKGIQEKIKASAHQEFGKEEYFNKENLVKCLNEGKLHFEKSRTLRLIPVENCDLPDYVKENLDKFRKYIR